MVGLLSCLAFVDFVAFCSHSFYFAGVVEWQTHQT